MKVAVLFGGSSAERDVSVASAVEIVGALREANHEVTAVDMAYGILSHEEESRFLLAEIPEEPPPEETLALYQKDTTFLQKIHQLQAFDIVFLGLHGGSGEDGTIQAALDLAGIPYTASGPMASALAMDKDISKRLFQATGIKTAPWLMAPASHQALEATLGYPLVVKPNKQGSTVGLTIVNDPQSLEPAIEKAARFGQEVLLEAYVAGRELTVGVLHNEPLAVGEIFPKFGDFFDYRSKYQQGGAEEIFPALLTDAERKTIQNLALKVHQTLKLRGYSRVDFRMDEAGAFWCLEANTLPGMAASSLLPQAARAVGISFPELCDRICKLGICGKGS